MSSNLQRMLGMKLGASVDSSNFDSLALLKPNTPAFNSQLQQEICTALNISNFYCASRIQVVSTTSTNPVQANVDFYPSTATDTTNAGPQSAADLLAKFQSLPATALSGLLASSNVAGGTITQQCSDGSFQAVCPTAAASSSSSSGTPWYVPVIVVVVVVVIIGLLVAAYFIKRRPKANKLDNSVSGSGANLYEPPQPATVPIDVAPMGTAAAAEEDANLPVHHVDYPAPTPGLKFMYTTPEWDVQSPSEENVQAAKATPRDVHMNLEDDHPDHV